MNYQNENKFITCVEDETRRDELGFTGIVTDMYKDKKVSNRIYLQISNRHVSRYLYDKSNINLWHLKGNKGELIVNKSAAIFGNIILYPGFDERIHTLRLFPS